MSFGCQSMTKKIKKIVIKHPNDAFISQEHLSKHWKEYGYVEEPDFNSVLKEYESFEKVIKDHVEEVYYLPKAETVGLDSIYTHDSLKITKKGAIYFNTGKKLRQKEGFEMERLLEEKGIPTLGRIQSPGLMEGGDVLWLNEDTVLIGRGYRTNDEGIRQFTELTKNFIKEIIVIPMPHGEGEEACLHLMSIISMIHDKLAVVYSKYMPVFMRELLLERGIELLEVNDKEYDYLGSNVLALDEKNCMLVAGNDEIESLLKEKGCNVYTYEGKNMSYYGTGGPTCLTCPVYRD
ncbi:amidinotransferase [Acidaminobacter sp. JC074]|uniref:dimethylarginine dimethylaminohydrolase family protein n=1 Tax=Acidaminobacter sp. JC074 TaxID=2530199 RepID=UPI001F0E405E|nr:arginine deiminase family protein [Acidaminobacter sp. JC074]MCH4886411.1 amidinotransferase [Acidaminobacter sp. JC074]